MDARAAYPRKTPRCIAGRPVARCSAAHISTSSRWRSSALRARRPRSACRPHHTACPAPQPHDGRPQAKASIRRPVGSVPHSSPTGHACGSNGERGPGCDWPAVSLWPRCAPKPHHVHCFVCARYHSERRSCPRCRSPCVWLTGHVHLRALANGTTRNRFGRAVSLELAWPPSWRSLVALYKGPACLPHVVSRVGPKSLIQ
jgi:hypothetical protein